MRGDRPEDGGLRGEGRDFPPSWHARVLAVSAAALGLAVLAAWKVFLT